MNQRHSRALKLFFLAIGLTLSVYSLAIASGSAGSVQTIQFHSTLVNKTLPYNVIVPRDYLTSAATRYPVLYLLHGLTGHYSDWVTKTNVADYAAQYRVIV